MENLVDSESGRTAHSKCVTGLVIVLVFVAVLVLDIATKQLILSNFELGESTRLLGDTIRLTYVLNQGGAFGLSIGSNSLYLLISAAVIVAVTYVLWRRRAQSRLIDLSLAGVLGGALGNLIDRLRFGAVIDFADVNIPDIDLLGIHMQRWPVFNVADAAVTVGMILIIAVLLFSRQDSET